MPRGTQTSTNVTFVAIRGLKPEAQSCYFDFVKKASETMTVKGPEGNLVTIKPGEYYSDGREQDFSGTITGIQLVTKEFVRDTKQISEEHIRCVVDDGTEKFWFDVKATSNLGRSIMNSFSSVNDWGEGQIVFRAYKNKEGYGSLFIQLNGEKMSWKYGVDQLPQVRKVVINGQQHNDYTDITDLLMKEFKEAMVHFAANTPAAPLPAGQGISKQSAVDTYNKMVSGDDDAPVYHEEDTALDELPF